MMTAEQPKWVYSLADESLPSVAELDEAIGGKAASLVRLHAAGKRVPPGFIIPPAACREYWALGQAWPPGIAEQIDLALVELEAITRKGYANSTTRLTVAVRSGATVSMPGTLATVLDVGSTETIARHELPQKLDLTSLGAAIRTVFDSWNSDAARSYRRARQIEQDGGTAVIVQAMESPRVSGVLFTRDPRSEASDQMVVEAVRGVGDGLLRGTQSASRWMIARDGPLTADVGGGPMLNPETLKSLRDECLQLEHVFGEALDLEWALDEAGWIFFQARPIKFSPTPRNAPCDEVPVLHAKLISRGETLWVRHNLAESLHRPTPLSWSLWERFARWDGGFGTLFRRLGFSPSGRPGESVLELLDGEIYASPRRLAALYCRDFPFQFHEPELRKDPSLIDRPPSHLDLDGVSSGFLLWLPKILYVMLRATRRLKKLTRNAATLYEQFLPQYQRYLIQEGQRELRSATQDDCRTVLAERSARIMEVFYPQLLLPGTVGAACFADTERQLVEVLGEVEGSAQARHLWTAIPQPDAERQQTALLTLAESKESVAEFMEQFGHRGFHEMELATPRWRDDPDRVLRHARTLSGCQLQADEHPKNSLETIEARVAASFEEVGATSLIHAVLVPYRLAWSLVPYREAAKDCFLLGYELIRAAIEALACSSGLGPDIYYLTLSELENADLNESEARIAKRRRDRENSPSRSPPVVWNLEQPAEPRQSLTLPILRGTTVCPGRGVGRVVFVDQVDLDTVGEAYVLVCQYITPDILTWLAGAAAVVVDQANVLSHGAVLAREFGVPVVSTPGATQNLTANSRVVVDADQGTVTCV